MARPTSRVSRVLMTGPLAPFADAYRAELQRARLYAAVDGRASCGRSRGSAGGWRRVG